MSFFLQAYTSPNPPRPIILRISKSFMFICTVDNLCKADNFTNQLIIQVTKPVVLSITHKYYCSKNDSKNDSYGNGHAEQQFRPIMPASSSIWANIRTFNNKHSKYIS